MTYLQRAVIAAVMFGAAAPVVGAFLVRRGLALVGDSLGHVAFLGVAVGSVLGRGRWTIVLAATLVAAIAVEVLRSRGGSRADLALAVVFYAAIAAAVLVLALGGRYDARALGILFGSLLTVSSWELVQLAVAIAVSVCATLLAFRPLMLVSIDEELAMAQGISPYRYGVLLTSAAAILVVAGIPAVGVLLVAAVMVLPAAAAQRLVAGFRASLVAASLLGAGVSLAATAAAIRLDLPPGATIVASSALLYVASVFARRH